MMFLELAALVLSLLLALATVYSVRLYLEI
jgi:hypothetical protein